MSPRPTGHHGVILSDSSEPVLCFRCIMAGNRIMKPMRYGPQKCQCQFLPFLARNAIMAGNRIMKPMHYGLQKEYQMDCPNVSFCSF